MKMFKLMINNKNVYQSNSKDVLNKFAAKYFPGQEYTIVELV